jgi:two-component system phosphate regulon sensor histidine kinase PhoR
MVDDPGSRMDKLIENPKPDIYYFRVDNVPSGDSLTYYLTYEFDDFNVYTDCVTGIYDRAKNKYVHEGFLPSPGSKKKNNHLPDLPVYKTGYSYVSLFFPHRQSYVFARMNYWIITTILVMLLLTGLSFSLYYFFRQKFLNEVQTDFINNVTHEFSTPLAVIELSADGLERAAGQLDSNKIFKYSEMVRHQAHYLKKHIESLMNTVEAEHHQSVLEKSPVIINSLVKRAVAELRPLTTEKKGSMILELEDDNREIYGEPDHLYLAIFNIMNNALKYATRPKVFISTFYSSNSYNIRVRDNGMGIDKKDINNIFRKFYRVQNGNLHHVKGLGLGLYFTRKVMTLHKGTIKVESVPGEGTTFTLVLPIS